MGIRQTSILAYKYLKDIGELGKRQLEVLEAFQDTGNATDREIACYLCKSDPNYIRPRRNELVELGYIEEKERREDKVTGKKAIVWGLR